MLLVELTRGEMGTYWLINRTIECLPGLSVDLGKCSSVSIINDLATKSDAWDRGMEVRKRKIKVELLL